MLTTQRTHPLIYTLITEKYATLHELQTVYSIEDALDMYEACLFKMHNKATAITHAFKK